MANTLVNLQQSLAQVEAKLDKLNHYREYLLSRIAGLSQQPTDQGAAPSAHIDGYERWAQVTTIRVADGYSAAVALANPKIKVLRPLALDRDLDAFVAGWNAKDPGERFESWATLFSWWKVAWAREDEVLKSKVSRAVALSGVPDSDDRIDYFNQFVSALILEDFANGSSR